MSHLIGTTAIPTPHSFVVTDQEIRREARLASGKIVVDKITTKKQFNLEWVNLTGTEVDSLLTLLYTDTFFNYTYPDETGSSTVTVLCYEMPRELWLNTGSKSYRGILVTLVEQ